MNQLSDLPVSFDFCFFAKSYTQSDLRCQRFFDGKDLVRYGRISYYWPISRCKEYKYECVIFDRKENNAYTHAKWERHKNKWDCDDFIKKQSLQIKANDPEI